MDDLSISDFWGNILAMFSGIGLAWFFMFVRKIRNISTMEPIILGGTVLLPIFNCHQTRYRYGSNSHPDYRADFKSNLGIIDGG